MSTLNKTGLRLAAAGAAAALTLAAGAPAFAQGETPTADDPAAPVADATPTDATTADADTDAPTADPLNPGDDAEVEDEKDTEDVEDVPEGQLPDDAAAGEEGWEHIYSYQYLDQILQGANVGESVQAQPEFYVEEAAADPEAYAGTVLVFTDTATLESVLSGDEWELTHHAYANADYDNCTLWDWGTTCVVTDFAGEADTTYTLSEETPLYFDIIDEVDENDAAAYYAVDLDAAGLEEVLADGYYDLEGGNQLALVETGGTDGDWFYEFGLFYFEGDLVLPDVPTAGAPALPTTGNSSIILISSAAAALLAGAVVFYLMRRRKMASNWE